MSLTNPPPYKIPLSAQKDPELFSFFTGIVNFLKDVSFLLESTITQEQADILTGGSDSDADSLHTHPVILEEAKRYSYLT